MPRIIFKCRYLKNTPKSHLANLVEYVATREGVEKVSDSSKLLPATKNQQKLILKILKTLPDTADLFEYEDYLKNRTTENASEFISVALENNLDLMGKKKSFVDYIARRPRAERLGSHGLFTDDGVPIVLSQVAEEVSNHPGNVWTNIISLRREDAARLGYDSANQWQALIRAQRNIIAENMKIAPENLRWYAAFHNESHHPHIHLIAYSVNTREAYVTKQGIENIRGSLAREIFRQDLMQIYEKQTERRNVLNKQSREAMQDILSQIDSGVYANKNIEEQITFLAERLKYISGKKQYGYLKSPLKAVVDQIVDELAKDERVAKLYSSWYEMRNEILNTYSDKLPLPLPLSQQKEFKSIKNMVIAEALNIGNHRFVFEPDQEDEKFMSEHKESDDGIAGMSEARPGSLNAQYMPGSFYFETDTDSKNTKMELEWLVEASKKANARAQYALAKLYLAGENVNKDMAKAVELLIKSASQDNQYAAYKLGKLYLSCEEVTKDAKEAVKWLTVSAEQGNQYAQYALGKLYLLDQDIPCDLETALQWLMMSATQGNIYAGFLIDHIESSHVPSVLLAATRLMHHLGDIFSEEHRRNSSSLNAHIDRKRRKKLREKKELQGHAPDDNEPTLTL